MLWETNVSSERRYLSYAEIESMKDVGALNEWDDYPTGNYYIIRIKNIDDTNEGKELLAKYHADQKAKKKRQQHRQKLSDELRDFVDKLRDPKNFPSEKEFDTRKVEMNEYRYETDAERARKALRLKGINLKQIHADTGIPYNTLKGYSRNLDSLYTASWSNVHRLSVYYQQHFADGIKTSDYIDTQEYINQIFFDFQKCKENTKVLENPSKTYKNVINKIKEIIDDPMYIYEIYRVIQESKEQDD